MTRRTLYRLIALAVVVVLAVFLFVVLSQITLGNIGLMHPVKYRQADRTN